MYDIKYKPKRGRVRRASPEMAAYVRQIAGDNSGEHSRLKRNLIRAMYYVDGMTVSQVAEELGVCPSTAYRTLHRAEQRLFRCLRYGAGSYLKDMEGDET